MASINEESSISPSHQNPATSFTQTGITKVGRFCTVMMNLSDAQLALSDMQEHYVNPYLEQLRYDLGIRGDVIFESSADPVAQDLGLVDELKKIGKNLKDLESYRFSLGIESWNKFLELGKDISNHLEKIISKIDDMAKRDEKNLPEFLQTVQRSTNKLKNEWELAQSYQFGTEFDHFRDVLRTFAYNFHRYGYLLDPTLFGNYRTRLIDLAVKLRTISTPKFFGFGGIGMNPIQKVKDDVDKCITIAEKIVDDLKNKLN